MKDIVESHAFCPRCGSRMIYFDTYSEMLIPDLSGKHAHILLDDRESLSAVCPMCKAKYPLRRTVYGILPVGLANDLLLGIKDSNLIKNPIGEEVTEEE